MSSEDLEEASAHIPLLSAVLEQELGLHRWQMSDLFLLNAGLQQA